MVWDQQTPMRWVSATHEFWYRLTNGLLGGNVLGSPILLLTVTGRKSGKRFTTPLLYMRDGDNLVVIASNNGSDRHPQWWLNLRANAEATAQVMAQHHHLVAHEAMGEERKRLWDDVTRRFPIYLQYERRTTRTIPVVVLHPAEDAVSSRSAPSG